MNLFPYSVCVCGDNCEVDLAGQVPEIEVTVVTVTTPWESESWRELIVYMVAFVAKWKLPQHNIISSLFFEGRKGRNVVHENEGGFDFVQMGIFVTGSKGPICQMDQIVGFGHEIKSMKKWKNAQNFEGKVEKWKSGKVDLPVNLHRLFLSGIIM